MNTIEIKTILTSNGYEVVSDQGLISMGNPSTLTAFLNYSYNKYKTGKYDLIIWDHGGAVDGSSYDELFRELKRLEAGNEQ